MTDLRPESAVRLPLCTSETITLSNLDLQLSNLRHWYAQARRVDAGIQLVHGLLSRYSVSARDADLRHIEALTCALVEQAPEDPRTWMALAGLDPVAWTPRKRGCSSWDAHVGGSPLSTKTKP